MKKTLSILMITLLVSPVFAAWLPENVILSLHKNNLEHYVMGSHSHSEHQHSHEHSTSQHHNSHNTYISQKTYISHISQNIYLIHISHNKNTGLKVKTMVSIKILP
jgi:hypothetical protein